MSDVNPSHAAVLAAHHRDLEKHTAWEDRPPISTTNPPLVVEGVEQLCKYAGCLVHDIRNARDRGLFPAKNLGTKSFYTFQQAEIARLAYARIRVGYRVDKAFELAHLEVRGA